MVLKGLKGLCGVEIVYDKGFLFGQIAKFLSMQINILFQPAKIFMGGSKNSNLMLTLHSVWRKRKQKVSSCRSGTCRMSDVSRCLASEKHFVVPLPRWEVTCHSGAPFSPHPRRPLARFEFKARHAASGLRTLLSVSDFPSIVVMLYQQPIHAFLCNQPVACGGLASAALPEETACPRAATV